MTALVSGEDTPLANKCFDFCKALASQGMAFSFSLTLGSNFSFSLETREMAPHSVCKDKAWKKKSPSTIRRNVRRREAFLQKKQSPAVDPARPLNILPSPTDSSGRRQVVSLGFPLHLPSPNWMVLALLLLHLDLLPLNLDHLHHSIQPQELLSVTTAA